MHGLRLAEKSRLSSGTMCRRKLKKAGALAPEGKQWALLGDSASVGIAIFKGMCYTFL